MTFAHEYPTSPSIAFWVVKEIPAAIFSLVEKQLDPVQFLSLACMLFCVSKKGIGVCICIYLSWNYT